MSSRLALIASAAALTVLLAGCSAGTPEARGTLDPSPETVATEEPAAVSSEPDGTVDSPFPLGTFVASSEGSQWDVTLSEVSWDATAAVAQANEFNNPAAEGTRFISVRITTRINDDIQPENVGIATQPYFSVDAAFAGNDGKVYDSSTTYELINEDWFSAPDVIINPGVESTGVVLLQVPIAAIEGGHLVTKNSVQGTLRYFGDAAPAA